MEERPSYGDPKDDPPPPPPLPLVPFIVSEPYIIQMPRDQIYRFPPPENATLVHTYRNPDKAKDAGCCGFPSRLLCMLTCLALLALLIGAIVAIVRVFFTPHPPQFSVTKLVTMEPSLHSSRLVYRISLEARNTNDRWSISYRNGGTAAISFDQQNLAEGHSPAFSQEAKQRTTAVLSLPALDLPLPEEVERSMNDKKRKRPVSLSLSIKAPVWAKGPVTKSKYLSVTCDFRVSTMATGTPISSENCRAMF